MNTSSLPARFIVPLSFVLIPLVASWLLYFNSWRIGHDVLHQWVAIISGLFLLAGLCLGSIVIYPLAFFRGARPVERVIACLAIPLIYCVYEICAASDSFTPAESLYYGLNPTVWMVFVLTVGLMGVCEWVCRGVSRLRGARLRVFTWFPLIAVAVLLLGVYFSLIWGNGAHLFYLYVDGYLALFAGV